MKRGIYVLISIIALILIAQIFFLFTYNKSLQESSKVIQLNQQFIISPSTIPRNIKFAGEKVPTNLYYVSEYLDRELIVNSYWHSSTLLLFKRAARYFPIVEPILKEHNIPDDFKYLALIESGFMNVTSPAGAKGYWQFLKGTAKDFGLEVTSEVDERYHIEKSTEAACKYLNKMYETYGNWTMVAASYNAGKRGINRQVERQKEDEYYHLLLNDETQRYVFRILAIKVIFEDPESYGFYLEKEELYPPIPYKMVEVKNSIDSWADFAKEHEITYKVLKDFNPWLRQSYLKNKRKKKYEIKIPLDVYKDYDRLIEEFASE